MKSLKTFLRTIFYKSTRIKRKLKFICNTNNYFLKFVSLFKLLILFNRTINSIINTLKNLNSVNLNYKDLLFFIKKKIGLKRLFGYRFIGHIIKFNSWTLFKKKQIDTKYMIFYINSCFYNSFFKRNSKKKIKFKIKFKINFIVYKKFRKQDLLFPENEDIFFTKKVLKNNLIINTKFNITKNINFNKMKLNIIKLNNSINNNNNNKINFFKPKYNKMLISFKKYKPKSFSFKKTSRFYSTFQKNIIIYNAKYDNTNNKNNDHAHIHNSKKDTSTNDKNNIIKKSNLKNNITNNKKKKFFSRNSSSHDIFLRKPLRRKKRKYLQRLVRLQQNVKLQSLLNSYKNIRNKTKFVRQKYLFNKNRLADLKKIFKKKIKIRRKKKKKKLNVLTKNYFFNNYLSEFINKDNNFKIETPTDIYFNKKKMIREWRQHYYRGNTRFSIKINDDSYIYIEKKNMFLLFKNFFTYFFLHGCGISSFINVESNNRTYISNHYYTYMYFYLFVNKYVFMNIFSFVKYINILCKKTQYLISKRYFLLYKKITLYYNIKYRSFTNKILWRRINIFSFIGFYYKANHFINSVLSFYLFKKFKFYLNFNSPLNYIKNSLYFKIKKFKRKSNKVNNVLLFVEYFTSVFYILHKSIYSYVTKLFSFYIKKRNVSKARFFKQKYHYKPRREKWASFYGDHVEEHSSFIKNNSIFTFNLSDYIYQFNNLNIKDKNYSSYFNFNKNSFDLNTFYFLSDRWNRISLVSNQSWVFMSWIWKNKFVSFINGIIFVIKLLFFIHIKKKKNYSLILLMRSILEHLFHTNISVNWYNYYNNIMSVYFNYVTKTYSIDYFYEVILKFIFQNKSYYLYYLKYYILNFFYLFYYIELTISKYINNNCFLLINYSMRWKYYLNSAKMWCEYIAFFLKKKLTIRKLFFFIKNQQKIEKNRMMYDYLAKKNQNIFLHKFKYALRGIRITYSGNFKKAKRKKKLYYYVWLSNDKYTGKMPLKKYKYFIDYYSTSVSLKRSNVGIKFWLLFNIF